MFETCLFVVSAHSEASVKLLSLDHFRAPSLLVRGVNGKKPPSLWSLIILLVRGVNGMKPPSLWSLIILLKVSLSGDPITS